MNAVPEHAAQYNSSLVMYNNKNTAELSNLIGRDICF